MAEEELGQALPEALSRDSASIKVSPNGERVREEQNDLQSIRRSSGGWNTKIPMLAWQGIAWQ